MTIAGIVLSHPEMPTTASKRWPRATSSTASATFSRLIREAFIPSVPMAIPSVTVIVLNSMGVPPAARTPSFTFSASFRWLKLHGVTSIQQWATPTSGRARSSSVNPTAFSMARAGARSGPSRSVRLLWRGSEDMGGSFFCGPAFPTPGAAVGPVLPVRIPRHRGRPLTLGDGTRIGRGDRIGDFHLDNERMAALHDGGRRSRWAGLASRRAFHASLEALAEQALASPRYDGVRAFTATTIFHEVTDLMGFEIRPLASRWGARLVAAYEGALPAHFHPPG